MRNLILGLLVNFIIIYNSQAVTYYSFAGGSASWDDIDIWNDARDGSGTPYTSDVSNQTGNIFIVQSGDNILLNLPITATSLTVESGGTLRRGNNSNVFNGLVTVEGDYRHSMDGGTIPTATWDINSNCRIIGNNGTTIAGTSQAFGNFVWNSSSQSSNCAFTGSLLTVNGVFDIVDCGGNRLEFNSSTIQTKNINIAANLRLNSSLIYVNGNFLRTGGALSRVSGATNIIFNGGTTQTFGINGTSFSGTLSFIVNPSTTLDISGSTNNLSLAANQSFTVLGTLITGSRTITANGAGSSFTLDNNATLNTSNASGVSGAILLVSGTRSFNNGSSYNIAGGAFGLVNTTIKNLTVSGTAASLNSAIVVSGDIALSQNLTLGASATINLSGNISGSNNLTSNAASTVTFSNNSTITNTGTVGFGNIVIGNGNTLVASSNTMDVLGDITNNSGTMNPNGGTIVLASGNPSRNISGATFYNLNNTSNANVTFANTVGIANTWTAGTGIYTHNGTIIFNGSGDQPIPSAAYNILQTSNGGTKTMAGNATVTGNLTIGSSTILDVSASNYSLDLRGDFINSNTFNARSGTVSLTGTNAQVLSGTIPFSSLTINKPTSGNVTISSTSTAISVSGFLTIANLNGSNKLVTNGLLTLSSDATNTGSLIDFSTAGSGGSVNGSVTVQRFHNGPSKPKMFGIPVESGPTVSTLGEGTWKVLLYTETGQETGVPRLAQSFIGSFRNANLLNSGILEVGRGYTIRKDAPGTINFVGTVTNGTVNIGVTSTGGINGLSTNGGYNLISNPYPSAIDWTKVSNYGGTGVSQSAVNVFNGSTYTATYTIAGCQGFFVRARTSGNITLTNAARIGSGPQNNLFLRQSQPSKWFYLYAKSVTGGFSDALAFTFHDNATPQYDTDYDLSKIYVAAAPGSPILYSRPSGTRVALDVRPYLTEDQTIPVTLFINASGNYKFYTSPIDEWYKDYSVFLKDSTSEGIKFTNLKLVDKYEFIKNTTDTDGSTRFSIILKYTPGANSGTGSGQNLNPGDYGNEGYVGDTASFGSHLQGLPDSELRIEDPTSAPSFEVIKTKSTNIYSKNGNIILEFVEGVTKSDIEIYDTMGNAVYRKSQIESIGTITIPTFLDGNKVYIVKLLNDKELVHKKLIVNQ